MLYIIRYTTWPHRLVVRTPGFSAYGGSAIGGHPANNKYKQIKMFYVYLIQSVEDKGIYIGYTSDLKKRLKEHNQGKTKSIKHRIPFILIYYEAYLNKTDARKREIELKKKAQQREILKKKIENSLNN